MRRTAMRACAGFLALAAAACWGGEQTGAGTRYADAVLEDRPAAVWRFESPDGARAADTAPGGTSHGTLRGPVQRVEGLPGTGGRAARFDGRIAYVSVPMSPALRLEALSIEFWLKTKQPFREPFWPGSAVLLSVATDGAASRDWSVHGASERRGDDQGRIAFATGPVGKRDHPLYSPPGCRLNDGQWHHVVATRTKGGEKRLYVDGKLAAVGSDGGGPIAAERPLHIGGDHHHADAAHLDGLLDEVAIYPHALPAERVAAHYKLIEPHLPPRKVQFPDVVPDRKTPMPQDVAAPPQTAGGWRKHDHNPILGGGTLGTMFDISVLREGKEYWMYASWRPKRSIALLKSTDGVHWGEPAIVLGPNPRSAWEGNINRPSVLRRPDGYRMWYTGQTGKRSAIGYATSTDGVAWKRMSGQPVLSPERKWEGVALMCPHVVWDVEQRLFRMWYSGGEQYEPDAIGAATSGDGLHWRKHEANPIFRPEPRNRWEQAKVTACQVIPHGGWHVMFYIGFESEHLARIGLARSRDGITAWQRHPANPIIAPGKDTWDGASCYKPFAVFEKGNDRWLLWYNGRNRGEQIGLAFHDGEDLGWDRTATPRGGGGGER